MIELIRTNDPILLSWLICRLEQAGIEAVVFDTHTSILEGSIGAIPRRVMVLEEQETEARQVLAQIPCDENEKEVVSEESEDRGNASDHFGHEKWLPGPVKP